MATIEQIGLSAIDEIDGIEREYISKMDNVMRTIERDLLKLSETKRQDGADSTILTSKEIDDIIRNAGYFIVVTDFLSNGYQSIIEIMKGVYTDLYSLGIALPDDTLVQIETQRQLDLQQFTQISKNHNPIITRELMNASIDLGAIDAIQDNIMASVSTMSSNTNTWITTGLNGFTQSIGIAMAIAIGVTLYQYVGPFDGKTRPFCRRHIGQIKTLSGWNSLDNGQINPVGVYRGGYNCRHILIGVLGTP